MSDFADRTDQELLDLANTRGIEGADEMTRDELVAALRGPASPEETTTEEEREENARSSVERENDLASAGAQARRAEVSTVTKGGR